MNRLSLDKRTAVISALVEGCSVRATSRMTDVAKGTILRLLAEVGTACAAYQDRVFQALPSRRIQCDEIWSFCYAKQKNVPTDKLGTFGYGDVWTWTAMDADTKLVPCWLVGRRDAGCAHALIQDLASRLVHRVQLTTDGNRVYLSAVEDAFGTEIDYAMLVKVYGPEPGGQTRYSPPVVVGAMPTAITGRPDPAHISTSYVERQNLTMRMQMRRFTRLTNGFSKKIENHAHAVALFYMHYNFARIHQTLRVTPAMEAGLSDHVWSLAEIVNLTNSSSHAAVA
jgi:IS1 family transposase